MPFASPKLRKRSLPKLLNRLTIAQVSLKASHLPQSEALFHQAALELDKIFTRPKRVDVLRGLEAMQQQLLQLHNRSLKDALSASVVYQYILETWGELKDNRSPLQQEWYEAHAKGILELTRYGKRTFAKLSRNELELLVKLLEREPCDLTEEEAATLDGFQLHHLGSYHATHLRAHYYEMQDLMVTLEAYDTLPAATQRLLGPKTELKLRLAELKAEKAAQTGGPRSYYGLYSRYLQARKLAPIALKQLEQLEKAEAFYQETLVKKEEAAT